VAIIVENGGFGAEAAAPIVRKALDYYLLGKRPVKENREPQPKVQSDPALFRSDQELKNPAEPPLHLSLAKKPPGIRTDHEPISYELARHPPLFRRV
jgi:hypothetical protein